ncbi:MAG: hypothetical protein ACFHXK_06800 [bacterium]
MMASLMMLANAAALGEGIEPGSAQESARNVEQSAESAPQVAQSAGGFLQLDETVISGNQELPKVLYILPWREPQGLPDIEIQAEFTEAEVFRRLYPPAYRRELGYFDTLSGLKENPDQEK